MSTVQLWVSGVLAVLRVLLSQSTEDIVLSRTQELSFSPYLISCPVINRLRDGDSRSAAEEHSEGRSVQSLPEETFSRCAVHLTLFLTPVLLQVTCVWRTSSALRAGCRRPRLTWARPHPATGPPDRLHSGAARAGVGGCGLPRIRSLDPPTGRWSYCPSPPGWLPSHTPHGIVWYQSASAPSCSGAS